MASLRTNIEVGITRIGDMLAFDRLRGDLTTLQASTSRSRAEWARHNQRLRESAVAAELLRSRVLGLSAAMTGLSMTGGVLAIAKTTQDFIELNNSLENTQSQLGVATEQMQLWQMAGEKVNLNGEKMRDIMQDVADKIGDFATTGGGEAKDIFEKLNLDIQELVNLSPDKILLKINEALEKTSDLSKNEEVFLMEALANDASKLLPILKDNAVALEEIRRIAEKRKLFNTSEEADLYSRAYTELKNLKSAMTGVGKEASLMGSEIAVAFAPEIADWIDNHRESIDEFIDSIGQLASEIASGQFGDELANDFSAWLDMFDNISSGLSDIVTNVDSAIGLVNSIIQVSAIENERDYSLSIQGIINSLLDLPLNASVVFTMLSEYGSIAVSEVSTFFSNMGLRLSNGFLHIGHGWSVVMNSLKVAGAYAVDFLLGAFAKLENARASILSAVGATDMAAEANAKAQAYADSMGNVAEAQARAAKETENYKNQLAENNAEIIQNNLNLNESNYQSALKIETAKKDRVVALENKQAQAELNNEFYKAEKQFKDLEKATRIANKTIENSVKTHSKATGAMEAAAKEAEKNKKATNKLTDAQKAAKKATSDLAKEHERIQKAFENEKIALEAHYIELVKGKEAAYAFKKEKQGLEPAMIKELLALKDVNKAIEESNKLKKESQKYYKDQLKSLDDQFAKLTLSERAYKALKVSQENLNPVLQAEVMARYDVVTAAEKQVEADKKRIEEAKKTAEEIASIGDDLSESIADKLMGGTESWGDILKNWWGDIKSYFAKNILQPLIQPFTGGITQSVIGSFAGGSGGVPAPQSGVGSLGGVGGFLGKSSNIFGKGGLVFGNSIGEGIVGFADKFGYAAGKTFSAGVSTSNLAFGAAGAIGGILGNWGQKGTYGGIGGAGGAMAGLAIGGPVGAVIGGLAGAALGGLFGGQTTDNASGLSLGLSGGQVEMQTFQDKHKDGGWIKKAKDWTEYNADLSDTQQQIKDALQTQFDSALDSMIEVSEYFGYESAASVVEGLHSGLEAVDTGVAGFAESVVATQVNETQASLIAGLSEFQNVDLGAAQAEQGLRSVIQEFGSSLSQASVEEFDRIQLTENGEQVSEDEATKRIQEWLSNTLSGIFEGVIGSDFDQYAILGENLAETLGRVYGEVEGVTQISEQLGLQFGLTGMNAIDAANSFVTTAGGLDNLSQISSVYYSSLWSESEQKQALIDQSFDNLSLLNQQNDTSIYTAETLKDVIQGLDLTTAAGQESYVALSAYIPALVTLGSLTDAYTSLLYSESEQKAIIYNQAVDDLTLLNQQHGTQITTVESLRDLIEGLDRTTAAGQSSYASLSAFIPVLTQLGSTANSLQTMMSGVRLEYQKLTTDKRTFAVERLNVARTDAIDAATELGASDVDIADINDLYDIKSAQLLVDSRSVGTVVEGIGEGIHLLTGKLGSVQDAVIATSNTIQNSTDKITLSDKDFREQAWSSEGWTKDAIAGVEKLNSTLFSAQDAAKKSANSTKKATTATDEATKAANEAAQAQQRLQDAYENDKRSLESQIFSLTHSAEETQKRAWAEKEYSAAMISTLSALSTKAKELEKTQQITNNFDAELKGLQDYQYELNHTDVEVQNRIWAEKEYSKTMIEGLQQTKLQISAAEQLKETETIYANYRAQLEQQHRELTLSTESLRLYQYGIENLTDAMIEDVESLKAANDSLAETQRIDAAFQGYKEQLKQQNIELRYGKEALQNYKYGLEGLTDSMITDLNRMQAANDAEAATQSLFESQLSAVGTNYQNSLSELTETYESQIDVFDTLKDTAKEIRNYISDLKYTDLSTLIPIDQLAEARAEFARLKDDSNNPESAALVTQAGQQVLELSRSIYGSSVAYQSDYQLITGGLEGVADQIDSLRDPQLDLVAAQKDLLEQAKNEYLRISELYQSSLDQEVWLSIINGSLGSLPTDLSSVLTPLFDALNASIQAIQIQAPVPASSYGTISQTVSTYNDYTSTVYSATNDQGQTATAIGGGYNTYNGLPQIVTVNAAGVEIPQTSTTQESSLGSALSAPPSYRSGNSEGIPHDNYLANLHKDEIVVDAPARFAIQRYFKTNVGNSGSNNNNTGLVAAIKNLTSEVAKTNEKNAKIEAELRNLKAELSALHGTQKGYADIAINQRERGIKSTESANRKQRRSIRIRGKAA